MGMKSVEDGLRTTTGDEKKKASPLPEEYIRDIATTQTTVHLNRSYLPAAMRFLIVALAALVAVTNAGFIGEGVAVAPALTRYSAPAFYGSSLAYHAPLAVATYSTAPTKNVVISKTAPAPKTVANDDTDIDPNPAYSYSYDIKDSETGDTKTMSETLENGIVKGSYSVVGPDGMKRTVEYTADDVNGFNAVINTVQSDVLIKTPVVKNIAPVPIVAKAVIPAAPAFYHAAPVAYHAPVAKVISAPVAKVVSSSPHSYSTYHSSSQPSTVTYHAAPVNHKINY